MPSGKWACVVPVRGGRARPHCLTVLEDTLQAQSLCPSGFGSGSWARWRFRWPSAFSSLPSWTVCFLCAFNDTNSSPGAQVRHVVMLCPCMVTSQGCFWWPVTSQLAFSSVRAWGSSHRSLCGQKGILIGLKWEPRSPLMVSMMSTGHSLG